MTWWKNGLYAVVLAILGVWLFFVFSRTMPLFRDSIGERQRSTYVSAWQEILIGRVPSVGPRDAKHVIVEFVDYQCPYCQRQEAALQELTQSNPSIAVYRINFPLTEIHPLALQAAIAAECATEQGAGEAFSHALFSNQKQLGRSDISVSIAEEVKIADLDKFRRCMDSPSPIERIDQDREVGNKLGVAATPTFIINGMLQAGFLNVDDFRSRVRSE